MKKRTGKSRLSARATAANQTLRWKGSPRWLRSGFLRASQEPRRDDDRRIDRRSFGAAVDAATRNFLLDSPVVAVLAQRKIQLSLHGLWVLPMWHQRRASPKLEPVQPMLWLLHSQIKRESSNHARREDLSPAQLAANLTRTSDNARRILADIGTPNHPRKKPALPAPKRGGRK